MLELTVGGRCISGEEAVEFFEGLAGVVPAEEKDEYEYALNRLRAEVQKACRFPQKRTKAALPITPAESAGLALAMIPTNIAASAGGQ